MSCKVTLLFLFGLLKLRVLSLVIVLVTSPSNTHGAGQKDVITYPQRERPREYVRLRPSALGEGTGVAAQSVETCRVCQVTARKSASKSSS
eukprot:1153884-Pelagomonas_calceolata.AAC.5